MLCCFPGCCSNKLNEGHTEAFPSLCSLAVYSLKKLAARPLELPQVRPPRSHPMGQRASLPLRLVVRGAVPRLGQG